MYIAYAPPPPLSRPRQILFLGDAPLPRPTEKDTSTKRGCPLFFGGASSPSGGEGGKHWLAAQLSGMPPSWCATVREKRFAVSLAFFWLTPIRSRARSWGSAPHPAAFEKAGKTFTLASLGPYSSHNTFNVSTSSCFSIPHSCAAFTASCRCSSTRRSCSSFKNSVFFPATKLPFPGTE